MSNRKLRRTQRVSGRPAPRAGLRHGNRRTLALLLAPLLLALFLGGWRAVADSLPQSAAPRPVVSAPASASPASAQPVQAPALLAANPASPATDAPPSREEPPAPASHGQWVLAPDALPTPAFPGDVPPLPVARSAQDPGFHPDLVLGTRAAPSPLPAATRLRAGPR